MKILGPWTSGAWTDLNAEDADGESEEAPFQAKFRDALTSHLVTQNLVVLTGLGTSLAVNSEDASPAPNMNDLWSSVKKNAGDSFDSVLTEARYDVTKMGENVEYLLSRCILANRFSPSKNLQEFISSSEGNIAKECRFTVPEKALSQHTMFLRKIARRPSRLSRTRIFTTNYDRCFEMAAESASFVALDGFSLGGSPTFDPAFFSYDLVRRTDGDAPPPYVDNVFHLYKLHGSVDWTLKDQIVHRESNTDRPLLIYPAENKFEQSYVYPFIEIMSRFQACIRQPNTALWVIGFGFNDDHISQALLTAVRGNVNLSLVVVSPALETSDNKIIATLLDLVKKGDGRIIMVNGTFQEFVSHLPTLLSESKQERHRRRLEGM